MEHDTALATTIPDFTPVPRKCDRSNGWKPAVQRAFIEALAETGSVKAACRRVGRADHGVYQLRRHPEAEEFRRAWQAALDIGIQRIEDVAMDRAINGVEEPVYNYGKLVGTRIRYNDRLLMFMLRNRAPGRFAGGGQARGLSAMDKTQLEKLRRQWHEEWEEEQAHKHAETEGEVADFVDQISDMHVTWWSHLSPRTRAAYREFRRLEKADFGWDRRDDTSEEDIAAAEAEHAEVFAGDGRSKAKLLGEICAIGDDRTCADAANDEADEPAEQPAPEPRGPRIRTLKDDGW